MPWRRVLLEWPARIVDAVVFAWVALMLGLIGLAVTTLLLTVILYLLGYPVP